MVLKLKLLPTRREFVIKMVKTHKNRFITDNNDC